MERLDPRLQARDGDLPVPAVLRLAAIRRRPLKADRSHAQSKIAIDTIGDDEAKLINLQWRDLAGGDDAAENAWDEIAEGYPNTRPLPPPG